MPGLHLRNTPTNLPLSLPPLSLPAEAYEPEYEHNLMYVAEYRPSDLLAADNGGWGGVIRGALGSGACAWQSSGHARTAGQTCAALSASPSAKLLSVVWALTLRPPPLPAGNVLRQARGRLEAFWTATCTAEGSFAWQAAQSFSVALMKTMQVGP